MVAERVPDQRVPAEEDVADGLAIPVPELLATDDPAERPPDESREPDANGEVEPDDDVRVPQHEIAQLGPVAAFDHPRLLRDERLDLRAEVLGAQLRPV